MKKDFKEGAKAATPIILGYIPVGIAYGMMAKATGLTFFKALSFSLYIKILVSEQGNAVCEKLSNCHNLLI
ncbi:hypothetical protein, partial [uncultured Holdemanella sp.]|uniref:hypothetical protein n=1 Tax=uncultured Holdemanella sp. TaxID=1763549 RepID=UPI0025E7D6C7